MIRLTRRFVRELGQLDKPTKQRVTPLIDAVSQLDDPRSRGKALTGDLRDYWRYRVGDYRVIVELQDSHTVIVAITVGHRASVYR